MMSETKAQLLAEMSGLLEKHREEIIAAWIRQTQEGKTLAALDPMEIQEYSRSLIEASIAAVKFGSFDSAQITATSLAKRAVAAKLSVEQILAAAILLRDIIGKVMFQAYNADSAKWEALMATYEPIARRMQGIVAATFVSEFEGTIRRQEAVMKLTTPLVEVWEGIAMIPLIGVLDSARAKQLTVNVLERVASTKTDVIVMDISGIASIDTKTANYMLTTIRSVKLMGADMVIAGIRPDVATTMVTLGIDLAGIVTMRTLREGLEYAFKKMKLKVTSVQ
jgi:rsbT co-antagonist protein RsbR